ncbi:ComEA family DNA-binding protein [Ktedonosporobacter rubrisoli]|uniref:ComEA family DNA-binding protein n=1 Tax=Ktedonosporobacter rubrisoli TaxID=2509675 RepID=A0A4P6JT80_KTERU|nr:ComEA family DNA-binding protein [Ktedonosporobacter rubrisoli]QBD78503.1 ComEA family DNA-binding protein [Ktedonosporobacter rubrisoli]
MEIKPSLLAHQHEPSQDHISQQPTIPHPALDTSAEQLTSEKRKRYITRGIALGLALALALTLYFIWRPSNTSSTASSSSGQSFNPAKTTPNASAASTNTGPTIEVYVTGAVKHPGVYKLTGDARVYQLLQAAGGPQANANLVALNLAAKLNDGQEVYVTIVGERPPTYVGGVPGPASTSSNSGATGGTGGTTAPGQLVNINTASADDLRKNLHISSTTAQAIVNYRMQQGPYTSVEQLSQVVSSTIFNKIKGMVTV